MISSSKRASCVVSQSPRRITLMSTERRTVEVCIDQTEVRSAPGDEQAPAARPAPTIEQMLEAFRAMRQRIGAEPEPHRVIDELLKAQHAGSLPSDIARHPS